MVTAVDHQAQYLSWAVFREVSRPILASHVVSEVIADIHHQLTSQAVGSRKFWFAVRKYWRRKEFIVYPD